MNITFVSGNPHLPQLVGGVEVNTHELARELTGRGHQVCVLAKLSLRNGFGLRRGIEDRIPDGTMLGCSAKSWRRPA